MARLVQNEHDSTPSVLPSFPLYKKPQQCWASEHRAIPFIVYRTWTGVKSNGKTTRPYYSCITCDNWKTNVFRNCGYPRGFVTWDDEIGLHPDNPRCFCGAPSRQDRKCSNLGLRKLPDGFWVCATGSCRFYSDRKDGMCYEEARMLYDDADFRPWLLRDVPPFC